MEIEAKYRLSEPTSPEQIEALDWQAYRLGERSDVQQHDTLWDTPDMRLSASRNAVRLREGGKGALVTIKGPGTASAGVHEREELELPTSGSDPAGWPEPIRDRLRELVGDAQLSPIFVINNHRRAWPLLSEGKVVGEVALDRGTIEAGGHSMALHELEVELKGAGVRAMLDDLDALLRRQLPAEPENRSKFERGVKLLNG